MIPRTYQVSDAAEVGDQAPDDISQQSKHFLLQNNGIGEGRNTYYTLSFTYDFEAR